MERNQFTTDKEPDKIEITKQQIAEIQKVFDSRIVPHRNHTLFQVNVSSGDISEAEFDALPELKWEDAVKGLYSADRKVTKKENCLYISALNKENVIKILKRDYKIEIKTGKPNPDNSRRK